MPEGSINLGHVVGPTGPQGATGPAGPQGVQGPVGPGVPAGGTAGQVLRKTDGTNYNTEWHSLDDADIPSSAVSGQTTVEGALGSLSQQIENVADEIEYYRMPTGRLKNLTDVDLNTIIQSGVYYITRATNGPANAAEHGYLTVMVYSNIESYLYIHQEFRPYNSPYVYVRNINETTWTEWTSINVQIVNLGNAIAYVENGNNATRTYTAGQYLLWNGTLYTVNSGGIPSGTAISGHVTAVSNGGMNALKSSIDTLNNNLENIVTHPQYLSEENDWDTAIENYIDNLPNDNKCHIAFIRRTAAGAVMCIIQRYIDANYTSALTFGYWREPYFYVKDGGTWTVKKITLEA